jgi:NitT/TauT family transport system permease protein
MTVQRLALPLHVRAARASWGLRPRLLPLAGLACGIALWALGTIPWLHASNVLTAFSPAHALPALWDLIQNGTVWPHLWVSLKRVAVGLGLALAAGVPVGLLLGYLPWVEQSTRVLFQFVRMISPLSWTPIAIMVFGIGDVPVYFLIAVTAIWPIVLNTAAGIEGVDGRLVLVGRSLGATHRETIRAIILPAVAGHLFTGLRLALGLAWIVLVPAEMLGVSSGLGYFILDTRDRLAYPELMAVVLLIGTTGYVIDAAIRRIRWRWSRVPSMHDTVKIA